MKDRALAAECRNSQYQHPSGTVNPCQVALDPLFAFHLELDRFLSSYTERVARAVARFERRTAPATKATTDYAAGTAEGVRLQNQLSVYGYRSCRQKGRRPPSDQIDFTGMVSTSSTRPTSFWTNGSA
jgi:hypothetical protein